MSYIASMLALALALGAGAYVLAVHAFAGVSLALGG